MNIATKPRRTLLPSAEQLALVEGDRVIVRHDDGFEEPRTVSAAPARIKIRGGGRAWAIWLDGTAAWFALWRVRPCP